MGRCRWRLLPFLLIGCATALIGCAGQRAGGRVLLDANLEKHDPAGGVVTGGVWSGGWRATDDGQRVVWDLGRPLRDARMEVWFTYDGNGEHPRGLRGQWLGAHGQPRLDLDEQYLQLRAGRQKYGFSKLRVKGRGAVRCEITGGDFGTWGKLSAKPVRVALEWRDGVPSFTDPSGTTHHCTRYHKATGPIVVDALRWVFIGSDNTQSGAGLPGLRIMRIRVTETTR